MTSQPAEKLRLLMIGPLPPPFGGTTVLFDALARGLDSVDDISVDVLGTGDVRGRGLPGLLTFLKLAAGVWRGVRRADVAALHISTTAMHVMGPLVVTAARLFSTPLIIRKFGGTSVFECSAIRRAVSLWVLRRSDVYLVETKRLVERARREGLRQVRWYPNSRPMPELASESGKPDVRCSRFIFLGQIRNEKGIRELVEATRGLPDGLSVDLYGGMGFDVDPSVVEGVPGLSYRGVADPQDVHELLLSYDALVLPSYREGYPGAVLEAYAAGLPVVVARWEGVREVADDGTGVTVEPRDAAALRAAMLELHTDPGLYSRLRQGVIARRGDFSEERWQENFAEMCRELKG